MIIRRLLRLVFPSFMFFAIDGEGGAADPAADGGTVDAGQGSEGPAAPASMFEAISRAVDDAHVGSAATSSDPVDAHQPRDDKGRFAPKTETPAASATATTPGAAPQGAQAPAPKLGPDGKPIAAAAAQQPGDKAQQPAAENAEDLLAVPEGLQPKAQERFQRLANANRELSQKFEQAEQQIGYISEQFKSNGVRREQFEQATAFIGAINKGDLQSALQLLDKQRAEIALALGQPLPGVDALSEYPDLRQAVDGLQITEQHAMEIARGRRIQAHTQQVTQAEQQRTQAETAQRQEFETGLKDIDDFCKQMQGSDMDFDTIESMLLPEIQNLIQGVPPQRWRATVEAQYRLLKRAAGAARQSSVAASGGGTVLRPTGAASPSAQPRSAYEAMWGQPSPSA